jgi:thiol-disulfide isomerase/thioredoxin
MKKVAIVVGVGLIFGVIVAGIYLRQLSEQAAVPAAATGQDEAAGDPEVGDIAPGFSVKSLDGKDLTLSDFKGKYVLLDFWASWCGPCREEMPNLKAVYDAHGQDERLAMISLSIDQSAGDAQDYASQNGMTWFQGFLPGVWDSPLLMKYGVTGIPSIWLIGPDGKVIAKDLRGDDIETAVETALKK